MNIFLKGRVEEVDFQIQGQGRRQSQDSNLGPFEVKVNVLTPVAI